MNSPFQIRMAVPSDAEAIAAFNSAMSIETEGIVLPQENALPGASAVFDDPSLGFYLIAETDGELAGSLMITYEWSDWSNAMYWWIQSVYVAPEQRRQGVYKTLYDRVIAMAQEDGNVRGIKLYVYYGNESAQTTYESLGMHRSEHHIYEAPVWPGEKSRG
jgi:ribosomal protein S18 acetylase RimI-like enzyme